MIKYKVQYCRGDIKDIPNIKYEEDGTPYMYANVVELVKTYDVMLTEKDGEYCLCLDRKGFRFRQR